MPALFTDWRRERFIKKTLRRVARQRIVLLDVPGAPWVVEHSIDHIDVNVASALRTCHMRGWVEPLSERSVPMMRLGKDGALPPEGINFTHAETLYRLTEAGWSVIHRTQAWVIATFAISLAALVTSLAQLFGIELTF